MSKSIHRSVLLNETIEGLNLSEKSVVLDATYGGGGHSQEILKRFPKIRLVTMDQDSGTEAKHHSNFRDLNRVLESENLKSVDGIIFDLGFSSDQLENSGRGFSFQKEEPLGMNMDPKNELTAEIVVNRWSAESLTDIIRGYGEEKNARKIAEAIVKERETREIKTTGELVKIIEKAVPRRSRIHPATKTFQAIRIAVNDELGALREGLQKGFAALGEGGRLAVISFNSLEDRIVKNFYRQKVNEGLAKYPPAGGKKPITPSQEELKANIRARSAKLRIIEKQ